jgi:hypothetical protein
MATKKHLSNTEWGLVVAALATADLTMLLLDFTGVGEFVDPFIDTFIAMAFPFYMHMRGQDMTNGKRLAGAIITWLTGLLSDGFLDFWWADAMYYWSLDRADEKLEKLEAKVPGGKMIGKIGENKIADQKRKHDEMMEKFPSKNSANAKTPRWLESPGKSNNVTPINARQTPDNNRIEQQKKDREERQKREAELSQAQTRVYMEKNYKGGYEKYKADNEKSDAMWKTQKEKEDNLKKSRQTYLEEDRKLNGVPVDIDKAA